MASVHSKAVLKHLCFYYILIILHLASSSEKESEECRLWSNFENLEEAGLDCKRNVYCTGVNCTGNLEGFQFKTGLWLEHCADPIKAVVILDVPSLDLVNWKHEFSDGEKTAIPGAVGPEKSKIYIKITINKSSDGKYVMLGISLMLRIEFAGFVKWTDMVDPIQASKIPVPKCKDGKPVTQVPIPLPTTTGGPTPSTFPPDHDKNQTDGKECDMRDLFTCGNNATCQQLQQNSNKGRCVCNDGFQLDVLTKQCSNKMNTIAPKVEPMKSAEKFDYIIVVATVVPIVALLLCATLAFVSVRFRWWQRVRSRFQVRVYDQILIGGPQDAEDDDPVA